MKYIPSKTLEQILRTPELLKKFKIDDFMRCLFAVAEGMSYLHTNLIIHGNLCPSNIIVDEANQFYICDFGLFPIKKIYVENEDWFNKNYKDAYMKNDSPSLASDIYSYGILMCDICFSYLKSSKKIDQNETLQNFLKNSDGRKFDAFPSFYIDMISTCLNSDASKRPSFNTIIKSFNNENQKIYDFDVKQLYQKFLNSNYSLNLENESDIKELNKVVIMHNNGKTLEKDCKKVENELNNLQKNEQSTEQGNANVLYEFGNIYYKGKGVEQDYNKAKEYYEKAAELGDAYALYDIGYIYYEGEGVEQDYNKAK